jgi:hypothetical protein
MDGEIIFDSAFDAVRFALSYSTQQYGASLMCTRFGGPALGSGMGLVGLDGAGQAGMIRRALWELSDLHLATLVARAAPREMPCTCGAVCCSKHRPNPEWQGAIKWLTEQSAAHVSGFSHYQVRRAIIERIFGSREDLKEIATRCDVHRNTVGNHYAVVRMWLEGRKGRKGVHMQAGVIDDAWQAIETGLAPLGILPTPESTDC